MSTESIGRPLAGVVSAVLSGAATTGQEVAPSGSVVSVAPVAGFLANLDPAHLPGAKIYVSPGDYAKMAANDITGLRHLSSIVPVVPTNSATSYVSGTVSGPVLANLRNFLTMRRVNSIGVQVSRERYAELMHTGVIVHFRADFLPTA